MDATMLVGILTMRQTCSLAHLLPLYLLETQGYEILSSAVIVVH